MTIKEAKKIMYEEGRRLRTKKPKKRKLVAWAVVYPDGSFSAWSTKQGAENWNRGPHVAFPTRIVKLVEATK